MDSLRVEMTGGLLTGSLTKVAISVNKVEVEDYKAGFQDADGNDFKEISFD